jgi:GR25 family glycosyltransferase involved in LPS biosynthesis
MLNSLAKKFTESGNISDAITLMKTCRIQGYNHIGVMLGKFFCKYYPFSCEIYNETALCAYYSGDYAYCHETYEKVLGMGGLPEKYSSEIVFNDHFCINHIMNDNNYYNPVIVKKLCEKKVSAFPQITVTITSCKRFDLFEQTINSFLNCCLDIDRIDEWFCVDDNSSEEDRKKMEEKYPFFNFYWKTVQEKGHPQSMNIIKREVSTPYIFHMEDDWKFFTKRNYMTMCLNILSQSPKIGQCLINRNYAEIESDVDIVGGEFNTTSTGVRYYIHEHCATDESRIKFVQKYGQGKNCAYWPHYSFRPSLLRKSIWDELGNFNEEVSHFEMEYSQKYKNKGYVSAFMEGIYCMHTGRLTTQRNDKTRQNAYDLNDEAQFSGKEQKLEEKSKHKEDTTLLDLNIKTYVLNLERRPDRWEDFKKFPHPKCLGYERYKAVDGEKLQKNEQLSRIFDGNDYNMRVGLVGCAMSHIAMCIELVNSQYDAFCILEDDLEFVPDFRKKFLHVYHELDEDWDMVYLGHHLWKQFRTPEYYDKKTMPILEKWDTATSMTKSMGGTGGYLISKKGAEELLKFINEKGMTNGIDTVQQKAADVLDIYYCKPHLIYSECFMGDNQPDTDIQFNFNSLTIPIKDRYESERKFYESDITEDLKEFSDAFKYTQDLTKTNVAFYKGVHVLDLHRRCVHPSYTLGDKVLIVVPRPTERHLNGRYFDRLKKNKKWSVEDALLYV